MDFLSLSMLKPITYSHFGNGVCNDAICTTKWGFLNDIDMIIEKVNQMASQYCEMKPDRVRPTRGENRF